MRYKIKTFIIKLPFVNFKLYKNLTNKKIIIVKVYNTK